MQLQDCLAYSVVITSALERLLQSFGSCQTGRLTDQSYSTHIPCEVNMRAGKKSNNKQFDTYGAPYGQNDVIGCLLDWDSNTISFSKNGEDLGPAFQIPGQVQGKALFPAICLKNAELVINFGEQKLQYGPPKKSVGLAKAPQEWISSGQGQQSEVYP